MKNSVLITITLLILSSCQPEGRVFVKHKDLSPNLEWLKVDKREFEIPIENNSTAYNLALSFRYANGYQYQIARVTVTEISPSGKKTTTNHELKIRDDNGAYLGEPGYDIWDSEHVIESNKTYSEKGTYVYVIEHNMPYDPLNFAMEVGVILDEIKK